MYEPESTTDDSRMGENLADPAGKGVCGDIEILGLSACEQIPHGPAHDVRLESRPSQPPDYGLCIGVDESRIDPMIFLGIDVRFFYRFSFSIGAVTYEQVAIVQVRFV
jgi:hypothetical protein